MNSMSTATAIKYDLYTRSGQGYKPLTPIHSLPLPCALSFPLSPPLSLFLSLSLSLSHLQEGDDEEEDVGVPPELLEEEHGQEEEELEAVLGGADGVRAVFVRLGFVQVHRPHILTAPTRTPAQAAPAGPHAPSAVALAASTSRIIVCWGQRDSTHYDGKNNNYGN